nr:MAG TPA: hypothetical protein [Caudoviricetes sp.]
MDAYSLNVYRGLDGLRMARRLFSVWIIDASYGGIVKIGIILNKE